MYEQYSLAELKKLAVELNEVIEKREIQELTNGMSKLECPKCGTRARVIVLVKAKVRCILEADDSVGKVLSASRDKDTVIGYECGGGHTWTVT